METALLKRSPQKEEKPKAAGFTIKASMRNVEVGTPKDPRGSVLFFRHPWLKRSACFATVDIANKVSYAEAIR